jgi:hypothetical protein
VPAARFSLRCRQQACEHITAGDSVEQAAPHCKDLLRSPDPSTLRRWVQRRLLSVCCWVKAGAIGQHFLWAPTIAAWDLIARTWPASQDAYLMSGNAADGLESVEDGCRIAAHTGEHFRKRPSLH